MLTQADAANVTIVALLDNARRLGLLPVYRTGTVFADATAPGRAMVTLDNDIAPTPCFNYAGLMGAGQRALVLFVEPHGAYVIGAFSAAAQPDVQTIDTTGVDPLTNTWTKPTGMVYATVEVQAGGGGGGGAAITAAGQWAFGDGGGGGEYAKGTFLASQLGATELATVGTGGTAVAATAGGTGGTSSFGALMTAIGGGGGAIRGAGNTLNFSSNTQARIGGTGGIGGDLHIPGSPGSYGFAINSNATGVRAGDGGSSFLAGGQIENLNAAGHPGQLYGGGGGGVANSTAQGTARAGGIGGQGIVIVTSYFA